MANWKPLNDQLDAVFDRISMIPHADIELRADFSRYLCVLVSGFLEQSVRDSIAKYVRQRSQPAISNFVIKTTERVMNLKTENLIKHLVKFDPTWQAQLEAILADEAKDAINSVVTLRHTIAHGASADITYERISRYYAAIKRTLLEIDAMMAIE